MAIKQRKPTNPASRFQTYPEFDELTQTRPHKALTKGKKRSGGRNNQGEITIWFRGGAHKRRYRQIDFKRNKHGVPAKVASIEYDPNRSARICLLHYADGEKRYILWAHGLEVGDTVMSGEDAQVNPGNTLPLAKIPLGTIIHNLELRPGKGGQLVRSAGAGAQLMAKRGRLRAGQAAVGRGAQGPHHLLRDDRPGGQPRPRERLARQGGAQPLARSPAAQPRRGDEPGGPPDGRRRRPVVRRPSSLHPLGRADQGLQDPQQQAHRRHDRPPAQEGQVSRWRVHSRRATSSTTTSGEEGRGDERRVASGSSRPGRGARR